MYSFLKKRDKKCSKTSVSRTTHFILSFGGMGTCPVILCLRSHTLYSVIYTALYIEVLTSESRCCHSNCRHFNSSWGKPHRPHNHCHRCCHGWTLGTRPVILIVCIYFSMFLLFLVLLSTFLPHPSKNHLSLFWNFYRGIL